MKEEVSTVEKIVEEFLELVKINSDTRNERAMADILTQKLTDLGCAVKEDHVGAVIGGTTGNLYAVLPGSMPGSILLTAHMDRVPNGENIEPAINDGVISTAGDTILAADDVAGISTILDCLRRLQASNKPYCTVEILFTVSEEVGLAGSRNLDYSMIHSKIAYVFDSSGRVGRIINSAPSKADIIIEIYGKTAHAGNEPEKGIDAAKIAGMILAEIPTGRLDPDSVSNFPIIRTNAKATNVVCDHTEIIGEARSRVHKKLEDYLNDISNITQTIARKTGSTIETKCTMDVYAFHVPEEDTAIQNAVYAMKKLQITPTVTPGGGCMDANWFNKYGIRAIGLATGYMANHTTNEHLYIEDLKMSGQLAEELVRMYSNE